MKSRILQFLNFAHQKWSQRTTLETRDTPKEIECRSGEARRRKRFSRISPLDMELLLNALWLLLSAAGLLLWLRLCRSGRGGSHAMQDVLVIGFAVALLFPVISMSDDLHAAQLAMEEASISSKSLLRASDQSRILAYHQVVPALALLLVPQNPLWQTLGSVDDGVQPTLIVQSSPHRAGRAPPRS